MQAFTVIQVTGRTPLTHFEQICKMHHCIYLLGSDGIFFLFVNRPDLIVLGFAHGQRFIYHYHVVDTEFFDKNTHGIIWRTNVNPLERSAET